MLDMLAADPAITAVSFNILPFWGGLDYVSDGWRWRRGSITFHRLFKWGPGYRYVTHQPPTVADEHGRDLRELKWVGGGRHGAQGRAHVPLRPPLPAAGAEQGRSSTAASSRAPCAEIERWAEEDYFQLRHPYRIERHYSLPQLARALPTARTRRRCCA